MRTICLHDTLSGAVRPLVPRDPGRVTMYACGPTVYAPIHVGNARPYVLFALLKRFLMHEALNVTWVANVTDVNDKIYQAARAAGVRSADLAREMTARYVADTDALNLGRPDAEPLASETIGPIVALIAALIDRGHAYAAGGDVYFAVRSYAEYGALSHRVPDDMDQGEGIEGAERKRDPLDFALWKTEKPDEDTAWDAPWGRGRPGWHIECSAMAEEILGLELDIHGGGSDLVFPHHENEAAQTGAARGRPLTRLWLHNGMVQLDREKMGKSAGNVFGLREALTAHGRDALILFFVSGHYRQPVSYSEERLRDAAAGVRRLREAARRLVPGASPPDLGPLRERFLDALAEDFSTPRALAVVFDWVRDANRRSEPVGDGDLRVMLPLLGLGEVLDEGAGVRPPDDRARELLARRQAARAQRDYAAADALREELRARGWEVRDGPGGAELVPGS